LIDYSKLEESVVADNTTVEDAAHNILSKHLKAFEELAK
jgi:antitoxin Phd